MQFLDDLGGYALRFVNSIQRLVRHRLTRRGHWTWFDPIWKTENATSELLNEWIRCVVRVQKTGMCGQLQPVITPLYTLYDVESFVSTVRSRPLRVAWVRDPFRKFHSVFIPEHRYRTLQWIHHCDKVRVVPKIKMKPCSAVHFFKGISLGYKRFSAQTSQCIM